MRWTKRDWTSVIVGWIFGIAAYLLIPDQPSKLVLIFVIGFVTAWVTRQLIPH